MNVKLDPPLWAVLVDGEINFYQDHPTIFNSKQIAYRASGRLLEALGPSRIVDVVQLTEMVVKKA